MSKTEFYKQVDWSTLGYPNMVAWLNGVQSVDYTKQIQYWDLLENHVIRNDVSFENTDRGYGLADILASNVHKMLVPVLIDFLNQKDVEILVNSLNSLALMAEFVTYQDGTPIDKDNALKIHNIIWGGLSTYVRLLNHYDSSVRTSSIDLLSLYPEYANILSPILLETMQAENDDYTKAYQCWSIHLLNRKDGNLRFNRLLENYIHNSELPRLQKTASMCLVDIFGEQAPSEALNIVNQLYVGLRLTLIAS